MADSQICNILALRLEDTTYSHEKDGSSTIDAYYEEMPFSVSDDNEEFETIPTILDTNTTTMSEFVNQASGMGKTPTFIHAPHKSFMKRFNEMEKFMKDEQNRKTLDMFASFKDLADAVANTEAYFKHADAGYDLKINSDDFARERFCFTNEFQKRCVELKKLRNSKAHNFKVKNYFTKSSTGNWEPNKNFINQMIIEKKKELEEITSFTNNELDVKIEDFNKIIIGFNKAFGGLDINLIKPSERR